MSKTMYSELVIFAKYTTLIRLLAEENLLTLCVKDNLTQNITTNNCIASAKK